MVNRASMVRLSISAALNRNARSGGSGLPCANAKAATPSAATAFRFANVLASRSSVTLRLRGDPVEIGRQCVAEGVSDNCGKFVGVALPDDRLHASIEPNASLDRDRKFIGRFDFASPSIK